MLSVKLVCVGKMKEKHYVSAFGEYEKRLKAFCRLECEELPETRLPEDPSPAEIEAALLKEAAAVGRAIPKGAYVIAMCIEGGMMSSGDLAALIETKTASGMSKLCFVVGGSFGLHDEIKRGADLRMSMSPMTFPHHLARVMLAEQIYRAFSINAGSRYHK